MTEQTQIATERNFRVLDSTWDGRSTLSVEEAGDVLGLSRATAYAAAGDTSGATTLLAQATQIDPTVPGGEAAQVQILSAVVRSAVASALAQPRSHK